MMTHAYAAVHHRPPELTYPTGRGMLYLVSHMEKYLLVLSFDICSPNQLTLSNS